jgi:hypothetical protein
MPVSGNTGGQDQSKNIIIQVDLKRIEALKHTSKTLKLID